MSFRPFIPRLTTPLTQLTNLTARRTFTTTRAQPFQRVQLIGRIGTDVELSTTQNNTPMGKYSLAVSTGRDDKRQTSWYRIVAFGEGATDRIQKGSLVFLEGDLKLDTYEGEDGKKHTSVRVTQRYVNTLLKPKVHEASEGGGEE